MPENRIPTGFWSHLGMVLRRAFTPYAWTRDLLIATGLTLGAVFLQARWHLIPDWNEHSRLWILSYAIPYVVIMVPHLLYRLAEAPWRVHQELESGRWKIQDETTSKLTAFEGENARLRERISKQTWPEKRPRITFDRWGNKEVGGYARQEQGFYLTNHGETALEIILEEFALGADKWSSDTLASIEEKQKGFVAVERRTFVHGQQQRWNLLDGFKVANYKEKTVAVKYRDFSNNWYRSFAIMKCAPNFGSIEIGPTTQEKLGSS